MPSIDDCLRQAMDIPGALGASLVDYTTGVAFAVAGAAPGGDPDAAATGTADVMLTVTRRAPFTSAQPHDLVEDVIITTMGGYHLLRPVRTSFDSRLVLYLWLDRTRGNLAIARRRLQALADDLVMA